MIILTRKIGERLCIDDDIQIKVARVNGRFVTLGFEAPKHIKIVRSELKQKRKDEPPIDSLGHDLD